ncbi:MAG: pyrimidine/purine nucleoside phosphorylase [Deferribacterales bacterium]
MSEFKNVSVVKKANVFFDGKVVSRSVIFEDGSRKTLGFIQPGEYTFNTAAAEVMEILSGEMEVLFPGKTEKLVIKGSGAFEIPANSSFTMFVTSPSDYVCSFA